MYLFVNNFNYSSKKRAEKPPNIPVWRRVWTWPTCLALWPARCLILTFDRSWRGRSNLQWCICKTRKKNVNKNFAFFWRVAYLFFIKNILLFFVIFHQNTWTWLLFYPLVDPALMECLNWLILVLPKIFFFWILKTDIERGL